MMKQVLRLGDPRVPWMFQKGDHVARRMADGSPDPHERGLIDDGWREYEGNWCDLENDYRVCIEGGGSMCFSAPESKLVKLD